jgi:hypothetical protein
MTAAIATTSTHSIAPLGADASSRPAVPTAVQTAVTTGSLVFMPLSLAIAWLVGYALRERTVRTEAAEERADRGRA